jgi:uncharacterized RDD family membrane protein YckC
MEVTEQDLRERYAGMETVQLLELQAQGTLTETAARILNEELARRSISPQERTAIVSGLAEQTASQDELLASLASPPQRFSAQFIDAVVTLFIFVPAVLVWPVSTFLGIAGLVLTAAYLLLADGLPNGQSIGKRVLGIAVIDQRTRKPCTYVQSFVRNFLLTLLGILDWIFIFGRMHQRLGDMAASTIVVRLEQPAATPDLSSGT